MGNTSSNEENGEFGSSTTAEEVTERFGEHATERYVTPVPRRMPGICPPSIILVEVTGQSARYIEAGHNEISVKSFQN